MIGNNNDDAMVRGADGRYMAGGDTFVKVYQIDPSRHDDEECVGRMMDRSMGWDFAEKRGSEPRDLNDYRLMWEGYLNIHGDPETAFAVLQDYRPIETSMAMHSLSVGDMIDIDGKLMFVDNFGFRDVTGIREVA